MPALDWSRASQWPLLLLPLLLLPLLLLLLLLLLLRCASITIVVGLMLLVHWQVEALQPVVAAPMCL
jgi:hypothetical protein